MATPTVATNKSRVLKKIIAVLVYTANTATQKVGSATIEHAVKRVWISAGVPSGGTGVAIYDVCLDTTNNDVYRYSGSAWYKISVEA